MAGERNTGRGGLAALMGALTLTVLFSLCLGRYAVPLSELIRILLSALGLPVTQTWTDTMRTVVCSIRLPRVLLACVVGWGLAASGASYQSVFQNPMAAPDLLGATSGAAFGAALAILLGGGHGAITASAFGFSLVAVALSSLVGARAPGKRVVNLILSGVMVGSLFSAGTSYFKLVADPGDQLPAITYWLMGSLSGATADDALFAGALVLAGFVPLCLLRWRLNLLSLGDDEARAMGVRPDRLRLLVTLCATLLTAACVSVSGMIGWVGLVVPHLCRRLFGNDARRMLPASALMGALFLLLVDDVSRNLLATEIPIGILTAFLGAPFFLYLITRRETTR